MIRHCVRALKIVFRFSAISFVFRIFFAVFNAALMPLIVYEIQQLTDSMVGYLQGGLSGKEAGLNAGFLVACMLCMSLITFFDNMCKNINRQNLYNGLTPEILEKFKRLDYFQFEDPSVLDTINRMSAEPQEKILNIANYFLQCLSWFLSILGVAFIFTQVSWILSVAFLFILIPRTYLDSISMKTMNEMFNKQSKEERFMKYLDSLLSQKDSLLELKVFNAINYISGKYHDWCKRVLDERVSTTIRTQRFYAGSTLLNIIWIILVITALVRAVMHQEITIGVFVSVIGAIGTIMGIAESLSFSYSQMARNYLDVQHYEKFCSLKEIVVLPTDQKEFTPDIVFENVWFTYPGTKEPVLKGVSFHIHADEKVALVGKNGCGKSTIVKLLCKLYHPDSGRILVNGTDLEKIGYEKIHKLFGVIFQDYIPYHLTLRENIAFGNIDQFSNDPKIWSALTEANMDLDFSKFPKGLETPLGSIESDAIDLSGGQWQRIAIARALFSDSPFVILDEPTASLDPLAESHLYSSFAKINAQKGCILISHRLGSTKIADRILVISSGKIAESGSHEALISMGGIYAAMSRSQSEWYRDMEDNDRGEE